MLDEIRVNDDSVLSDLTHQMGILLSEEAGFFLDQNTVNEKGRSLKDVARDMAKVYQQTNEHLKLHYPGNTVAERWIAVNEFSARSVEETWL